MSKRWTIALVLSLLATHAGAQTTQDAAYLADISNRADKHVAALKLDDADKAKRVSQIIAQQYQDLRTLHEERDRRIKEGAKENQEEFKKWADLTNKQLHDDYLEKLSAELTPEQVETVKDQMTYNVVAVTYTAFQDMIPTLTDEQKVYILAQLKEAREIAMDGGTSKEKHAVFGKYKGRINNYLSKQGYDLKQANKDWAERRKAREASDKQQPAKQD